MPLDWAAVQRRYEDRPALDSHRSGRVLEVTHVGDERLEVRSSMWTKTLEREHLELAVELIEQQALTRSVADFVQQYGEHVTKERRSLAAHILEDLGYLD